MNKHERILAEIFGEPLSVTITEPIKVQVDLSKTLDVCSNCGMMPIAGKCDCATSDVCLSCGQMPTDINEKCSCD